MDFCKVDGSVVITYFLIGNDFVVDLVLSESAALADNTDSERLACRLR
jgi:hypothetical protein